MLSLFREDLFRRVAWQVFGKNRLAATPLRFLIVNTDFAEYPQRVSDNADLTDLVR